ncbi:hypothetical protein [Streptomyces durocortorensis]|uniref:Secreted protein n=1 Tax=Streptomyces durocortorensis TaxID=2811104 RepID=A0ABS2HYM9_9ACTN|nr:hypothetical protein [Streptomyces durocortorensis]MBM7056111.1 hypothetical protein [Streptomyces durocortorensis]
MAVSLLRSTRRKVVATATAAIVVAGGLFAGFGTNLFGPDRLCDGWVSAADAERALGGGGRLGDSVTRATGAGTEGPAVSCTVERGGWWPGGDQRRLTVMVTSERPRFPFELSAWKITGGSAVLTGATAGAVEERTGWGLLPEACAGRASGTREGLRPVIRVSSSPADADRDASGAILRSAADAVARAAGCAERAAGDGVVLESPSTLRETVPDEVCGIAGFALPELRGSAGAGVQERTSGSFGSGWFCDLSFSGDERNGPFTRFAVVRDPSLASPLAESGARQVVCGSGKAYLAVDNVSYPWEPEERAAAGLPPETELAELFATKVTPVVTAECR